MHFSIRFGACCYWCPPIAAQSCLLVEDVDMSAVSTASDSTSQESMWKVGNVGKDMFFAVAIGMGGSVLDGETCLLCCEL